MYQAVHQQRVQGFLQPGQHGAKKLRKVQRRCGCRVPRSTASEQGVHEFREGTINRGVQVRLVEEGEQQQDECARRHATCCAHGSLRTCLLVTWEITGRLGRDVHPTQQLHHLQRRPRQRRGVRLEPHTVHQTGQHSICSPSTLRIILSARRGESVVEACRNVTFCLVVLRRFAAALYRTVLEAVGVFVAIEHLQEGSEQRQLWCLTFGRRHTHTRHGRRWGRGR
mmetsp:Transcript_34402/g.92116  ORF Transcript_34402/g.92116 Transcript_34402/m.92116 type:complete len:225 (+) Transcript_34402:1114-1788(+)